MNALNPLYRIRQTIRYRLVRHLLITGAFTVSKQSTASGDIWILADLRYQINYGSARVLPEGKDAWLLVV